MVVLADAVGDKEKPRRDLVHVRAFVLDLAQEVEDTWRGPARRRWPEGDGFAGFAMLVAVFLGLFMIAGHYAAVALFIFALVRSSGQDGTVRAAGIAVACTAAIFLLFDGMLGIEMWRGLVLRHAAGFQDF